jgi:hypothetical protein
MKLIEAMKKEFRLLRILWRQIYDQVRKPTFKVDVINVFWESMSQFMTAKILFLCLTKHCRLNHGHEKVDEMG